MTDLITGKPHGKPRVGIIGGGPAGALCAHILQTHHVDVAVFDKGRRPGGRLSTRLYQEAHFDHGAQYMTARDSDIAERVRQWAEEGVLAEWNVAELELDTGAISDRQRDPRWVGVPGMSALVAHLLRGIDCHYQVKATGLRRTGLRGTDGQIEMHLDTEPVRRFDRVVITIPGPQASALLAEWPSLRAQADTVTYAPCWATMVEFSAAEKSAANDVAWGCARGRDPDASAPIAWIARNQTKPGRPPREAWVIHATPNWSRAHLEDQPDAVGEILANAAQERTGWRGKPQRVRAHRWRYALVEDAIGEDCLVADDVVLCGDGLLGGRVESALISGSAAAQRILQTL